MRSGSEIRSHRSVTIHPTAIVHPDAELGEGVAVGPFSIVDGPVKIGDRTVIGPRATVEGNTILGAENEVFTGAVIGSRTQDKKYDGGTSFLKIGNRNKIREYVTINPGTQEGTETLIGDDNLIMAYSHVAHDCVIHNKAVLANSATLAGHVVVNDLAIIGGLSAVHQFVHIGKLAIVGGCSKVVQDIPPFVMADGHPSRAYGINSVGLERAGIPKEEKLLIKQAFKIIFRSQLTLKNAVAKLTELPKTPTLDLLIAFLKISSRGICR